MYMQTGGFCWVFGTVSILLYDIEFVPYRKKENVWHNYYFWDIRPLMLCCTLKERVVHRPAAFSAAWTLALCRTSHFQSSTDREVWPEEIIKKFIVVLLRIKAFSAFCTPESLNCFSCKEKIKFLFMARFLNMFMKMGRSGFEPLLVLGSWYLPEPFPPFPIPVDWKMSRFILDLSQMRA